MKPYYNHRIPYLAAGDTAKHISKLFSTSIVQHSSAVVHVALHPDSDKSGGVR